MPLIYIDPLDAGIFLFACLAWMLPEMVNTLSQMAKVSRKGTAIEDHGSMAILLSLQWAGLVLNFLFAWILPQFAMTWGRTGFFSSGILIMLLGIALRWYAIRTLGSYFTRDVAVSCSQPVIQKGPYRLIRHPAYSGTLLTMLGLGLATTNWASLMVLMGFVFLGHWNRVRVEEKALVGAIGEPYIEYMRRTRRFIPLVF
jgi:protein-S-isoprenylcysteine O-methyltransferase Ste14